MLKVDGINDIPSNCNKGGVGGGGYSGGGGGGHTTGWSSGGGGGSFSITGQFDSAEANNNGNGFVVITANF